METYKGYLCLLATLCAANGLIHAVYNQTEFCRSNYSCFLCLFSQVWQCEEPLGGNLLLCGESSREIQKVRDEHVCAYICGEKR